MTSRLPRKKKHRLVLGQITSLLAPATSWTEFQQHLLLDDLQFLVTRWRRQLKCSRHAAELLDQVRASLIEESVDARLYGEVD